MLSVFDDWARYFSSWEMQYIVWSAGADTPSAANWGVCVLTLRDVLNKYPLLKPAKVVTKFLFEKIYGYSGEDRWLKMLADEAQDPITIVLDVGSAGGHYLGKVARFLPRAEIHHFEPRPDAAGRLAATVKRLGTDSTIHQVALSNQKGSAQFAILSHGDSSSLIVADMGRIASVEKLISVDVERLDDFRGIGPNNDAPIGLFKIDVEGAELNVLKGAPKTLQRARNLQLEVSALRHVGGAQETVEVFKTVLDAGFELVDTEAANYLFTKDPAIIALYGGRNPVQSA